MLQASISQTGNPHNPGNPWQQPKLLGSLSNSAVRGVALSYVRYLQSALRVIEDRYSVIRRSIRSKAIQRCSITKIFDLAQIEALTLELQAHDESALKEAREESQAINALVEHEITDNPHFKLGVPSCPTSVQLSYLLDSSFIKRRLSKICHRERLRKEAISKSIGGKRPVSYCSNDTLDFIRDGDKKNENFLRNRQVVVKETGETFSLLDLQKNKSKNKFNETYFIVKNLESIAQEQGFLPFMLTLTAPAKFHPNPLKGRCAFDAYSTTDSQSYLRKEWARFRSYLAKIGVPMSLQFCFGLRTAELHRDGCVHWHLVLFINPAILETFQKALASRFSSTQADIVTIDGCSTSTYALKYILKSVDFDDLPIDYTDQDRTIDELRKENDLSTVKEAARVRAGIRAMSIRQVQYYGINSSLTKFRMLNKITEQSGSFPPDVRKILDECRINPRNGEPKNLVAYKNFLQMHSEALELIHEETINKHGLQGNKITGIRFVTSNYEYITKGKYEVITRKPEKQQNEVPHLSTGEISSTANAVTLISIYPRRAEHLIPEKIDRPTASKLLKQAKLINPERYITAYTSANTEIGFTNTLNDMQISKFMSMT